MGDANREEIAKLEALYANNPGGRVFTHLAEAYRKAGDLDRARAILEDGLGRHADSASAHVVLGRVLLDQGATTGATSAFRRVLELDPENRVALRTLGDLNRGSGRREEALDYYSRLQQLDPGDDDLASLIETLREEPPVATAPSPEAEPAEVAALAPAEVAPELEEQADEQQADMPEQLVAEAVSAETALDWTAAEPESQEALPGDLAQFAQETEEASAADGPLMDEVPGHPADEAAVEPNQVQSAFEEISASTAESQRGSSAFEEPGQVSGEEEWSESASAAESAAETPDEGWSSEAGQLAAEEPWGEPVSDNEFSTAADSAVDGTFGRAPEERPAEPWSDLPATFEEPEGWTPGLVSLDDDAEPWTDSIDLTPDLTEAAEEDAGQPSGAEFVDLSVDPAAEEARETSFEEMLSSSLGENGAPADGNEEDLPTETLAELYRTQGFYERAIEVYRALLEARPDDVRLQARLREVELLELRQGSEESAAPTGSASEEGDEDAREAWMAGVASAWTGEETQAGGAPGLYSWSDEPGDSSNGPGPYLHEYMIRLLSWRPSSIPDETPVEAAAPELRSPEPPRFEPVVPDQPSDALSAEGATEPPVAEHPTESAEFGIEHDLPVLTLDQEVPNEPGLAASLMDWEPPIAEPAEDILEPSVTTSAPFFSEPPVEQTPMAATRGSTGNPIEDAFDEWFNADETPSAQDRPAESTQPQPASFAETPQSVPEGPPTAEESDDDLEMFRSWLQSLKR